MNEQLVVRPIEAEDFLQWKSLWDGYNAFYGRSGETALPDRVTTMTWGRFFDGAEPVYALVAVREGKLLGLVHFIFHRTTIAVGPTCYLQDLFTLEQERGQGVGRALVEEVYRLAWQAGANRVYWLTHESNDTAMRLYDKLAEKSGFLVYRKPL